MTETYSYWDPIGDRIMSDTFSLHTTSLLRKAEKYIQNPHRIQTLFLLYLFLAPLIIITFVALFGANESIIHVIIFSFVPSIIYYHSIKNFQENLMLFLMCQQQKWVYNPNRDDDRYLELKRIYPEVFNIGSSQVIEDQIWGVVDTNRRADFWQSSFRYTTGSGKSSHTHKRSVLMITLPVSMPINFYLNNRNTFLLSHSKYKTESEQFNSLFSIKLNNQNPDAEITLLKVLSPSVQVRLIDMAHILPIVQVGFMNNTMIFVLKDHLWKPKHTNFFKKVAVDERDISHFYSLIKNITEMPTEMLQYMD